MSTLAMAAVFAHSQSKGSARLALLAMADEANDEGLLTAYRRSHSHIARKANVDEGTVGRAVKALTALGELEVLKPGNGRASTDYRIVLPGLRIEGGQPATPAPAPRLPRGSTSPPQGVQDATPIIPFSPGDTPVPPKTSRDPFEDFWNLYPRKTDKRAARKAWDRLVPKEALAATVIAGAQRFAADPNLPRDEPQFIPHPTTWLNGGRWSDDPLPPRAKPNGGPRAAYRPPAIITDRSGPSRALTEDDL